MILTLFTTIRGYNTFDAQIVAPGTPDVEQSDQRQRQPVLDNSVVIMPSRTRGMVYVSRYLQRQAVITWVGVARSLPVHFSKRGGDYCGAGVFLPNRAVQSGETIRILDSLVEDMMVFMDRFDLNSIVVRDMYAHVVDKHSGQLQAIPELLRHELGPAGGLDPAGGRVVAFDASASPAQIPRLVDEAQESPRLSGYQTALIARDAEMGRAVQRYLTETGDPWPSRLAERDPPPRVLPEARAPTARLREPARPPPDPAPSPTGLTPHRPSWLSIGNSVALAMIVLFVAWRELAPREGAPQDTGSGMQDASAAGRSSDARRRLLSEAADPAEPARAAQQQRYRSVSDALDRMMTEEAVLKAPRVRASLEAFRDQFRQLDPSLPRRE